MTGSDTTSSDTGERAEQDARRAEENPVVKGIARGGFVASALVQALIGVIAIEVALHRSGSTPDQTGALEDVARTPGGPIVLWVAAAGSLALGLWLIVSGFLARDSTTKARWGKRARHWGRAVVYLAHRGRSGPRPALGAGASSSSSSRRSSAGLLAVPGGPVLLVLIGAAILVAGGTLIWTGVARRFERFAVVPHGGWGRLFVTLGVIGFVARGLAVGVVGVLLVVAAFTLDPKKAAGLDGALKSLLALPFGEPLLLVIGIGWIVAGVFAVLWARQVRLDA